MQETANIQTHTNRHTPHLYEINRIVRKDGKGEEGGVKVMKYRGRTGQNRRIGKGTYWAVYDMLTKHQILQKEAGSIKRKGGTFILA